VGSAVNDTTRELGGAFGVAVIGSLVSSGYRAAVAPIAERVPGAAGEAVRRSLGGALQVAARVGGVQGEALADAARRGFADSLGKGLTVGAVAAFLGALAAFLFLPARAAEPAVTAADRPVGQTREDAVLV
jgi:DHA2 family multidrug resistance protein-like MFS transporter